MIVFETMTRSVYELDEEQKLVRRVTGTRQPQPRQGFDGEWRPYEAVSPVKLGMGVCIEWPDGTTLLEGSPPEARPVTFTSPVIRCAVRT